MSFLQKVKHWLTGENPGNGWHGPYGGMGLGGWENQVTERNIAELERLHRNQADPIGARRRRAAEMREAAGMDELGVLARRNANMLNLEANLMRNDVREEDRKLAIAELLAAPLPAAPAPAPGPDPRIAIVAAIQTLAASAPTCEIEVDAGDVDPISFEEFNQGEEVFVIDGRFALKIATYTQLLNHTIESPHYQDIVNPYTALPIYDIAQFTKCTVKIRPAGGAGAAPRKNPRKRKTQHGGRNMRRRRTSHRRRIYE